MLKKIAIGMLGLVIVIVAVALVMSAREPADLWIATHAFAGCPSRPSCVSSVATDELHQINVLHYGGEPAAARAQLERVIAAMPLATIEHSSPEYLHVLFRTPKMRFRDDVELLVEEGGVIQVRSLSRFGYGDHGVNRARVEALRLAFAAAS
jgi:uncharacterized protein (DUF1499 family)